MNGAFTGVLLIVFSIILVWIVAPLSAMFNLQYTSFVYAIAIIICAFSVIAGTEIMYDNSIVYIKNNIKKR